MVATLYEVLFNHALAGRASARPRGAGPAWLEPEECLASGRLRARRGAAALPRGVVPRLPAADASSSRSRSKFLFVDLGGLDRACRGGLPEGARGDPLPATGSPPSSSRGSTLDTFRLGCTPVVNLFEQTAEPIALTQTRHEYRIVPDVAIPHGMEVYSVDEVVGADPSSRDDDRVSAVLLVPPRHDPDRPAGVLVRLAAAVAAAEGTGGPRST